MENRTPRIVPVLAAGLLLAAIFIAYFAGYFLLSETETSFKPSFTLPGEPLREEPEFKWRFYPNRWLARAFQPALESAIRGVSVLTGDSGRRSVEFDFNVDEE